MLKRFPISQCKQKNTSILSFRNCWQDVQIIPPAHSMFENNGKHQHVVMIALINICVRFLKPKHVCDLRIQNNNEAWVAKIIQTALPLTRTTIKFKIYHN